MKSEARWTPTQEEALNKLLDLVHDLMHEVKDEHAAAKYDRRHTLILDKMFPERVEWRKNKSYE